MKQKRKRRRDLGRRSRALAATIIVGTGFIAMVGGAVWLSGPTVAVADADVVVYKRSNCTCCHQWVSHLEDNGLSVSVVNVSNTASIQSRLGVPAELHACHTATAGPYWVEGHVPADLVRRLLGEQPSDLRGIAVAGMPIGSPGMEGANPERYSVMSVDSAGDIEIYATRDGTSL